MKKAHSTLILNLCGKYCLLTCQSIDAILTSLIIFKMAVLKTCATVSECKKSEM